MKHTFTVETTYCRPRLNREGYNKRKITLYEQEDSILELLGEAYLEIEGDDTISEYAIIDEQTGELLYQFDKALNLTYIAIAVQTDYND